MIILLCYSQQVNVRTYGNIKIQNEKLHIKGSVAEVGARPQLGALLDFEPKDEQREAGHCVEVSTSNGRREKRGHQSSSEEERWRECPVERNRWLIHRDWVWEFASLVEFIEEPEKVTAIVNQSNATKNE